MEAGENETDVLLVGRFHFSKTGFDKAIRILADAIHQEGWLLIDEIGPLELRGEGFDTVLKKILRERQGKMILIVREGLASQVQEHYGFSANVISDMKQIG